MTPADVVSLVAKYRYRYSSEKDLQDGLARVLGEEALREYRLNPLDRPDFFFKNDGIVVEVKIKGSLGNLLHQLDRYARLDLVKGLVVITARSTHAFLLPITLQGKPLSAYYLPPL